jgi:RNA polymerase sigma-B factor
MATTHPEPIKPSLEQTPDRIESEQLFERWQRSGDQRAREELVNRFMPLARNLARRYAGAREPFDDLLQVASLGLVKAIDRFDVDRGAAFSSFAVPTILGELRRYFRDTGWSVHVPRTAQENALAVNKAIGAMTSGAARMPTPHEIAAYLEWSVEDVLDALEASAGHHASSLDEPGDQPDGPDGVTPLDMCSQLEEGYERVDVTLALADSLRRLPLATQRIVALRFAGDLTQAEIGRRVGVSQMQVSRVLRTALAQIRADCA